MSEFKFHCPACEQKIGAYTDMVGQQVNCPACQQTIDVPDPNAAPAAPTTPSLKLSERTAPSPRPVAGTQPAVAECFQHSTYMVRRKFFKLFGAAFHIYDPQDRVVFYSKQKAFKLKEDIRIYTGEDMRTEVLTIQARSIIDFSAAYDVYDPATRTKVGGLKRKGFKSMVRDEWIFMDVHDRELGLIQEDSMALALVRRFLVNLIPQKYSGQIGGVPVCHFRQHFNPFIMKITLDFTGDQNGLLDRRLGLAAAVLLCAIEGKES